MDCFALCTSAAYQIKPLFKHFSKTYKASIERDVVHIEVGDENIGHAFFFPFGAAVLWNVSVPEKVKLLDELKSFMQKPLGAIETDEFTYVYGENAQVVDDEVILPNADILTKLAISYGIAQSVKLGTFEVAIQKTFDSTKQIPEDLARKGDISLSRREIRKKMGQLFIERNSVTFDVLEIPEFFWEHPELDSLYQMIANYLEIENRSEVLHHRLDVVHELFQMLGVELNHQHSSRLLVDNHHFNRNGSLFNLNERCFQNLMKTLLFAFTKRYQLTISLILIFKL